MKLSRLSNSTVWFNFRLSRPYHFTFTGESHTLATVVIRDNIIKVVDGQEGNADLHMTANSDNWILSEGTQARLTARTIK